MKIVVVNAEGVRERTAPNVNSYSPVRHGAGTVIEIVEPVIPVGKNEMWGMIKGRERAFVALNIGEKVYCVVMEPPSNPDDWMQAVDAWLRTKGYTGPKP